LGANVTTTLTSGTHPIPTDPADDRARLEALEAECASLRSELSVPEPFVLDPNDEDDVWALLDRYAADAFCVHSADGVFQYASESARSVFGYAPAELIGRSPYDFFHPEDLERIAKNHSSHVDPKVQTVIEYRWRRPDGSYVWLEATTATRWSGDHLDDIVSVNRDVSERHAAAEATRRLVDELERRVDEIRALTRLVPICAWCKSIRDDEGLWCEADDFLARHAGSEIESSICPTCAARRATLENG